jgi:hypothetical protein
MPIINFPTGKIRKKALDHSKVSNTHKPSGKQSPATAVVAKPKGK